MLRVSVAALAKATTARALGYQPLHTLPLRALSTAVPVHGHRKKKRKGKKPSATSTDGIADATLVEGSDVAAAAVVDTKATKKISPLVEEATKTISLLENIAALQKSLPAPVHITAMLKQTSDDHEDSFFKLFDLYRKHGNPTIDASFLVPGIAKCCEVGDSAQAVAIARDMVHNGRAIDRETLLLILKTAERNGAAIDAIGVLNLLLHEDFEVTTSDYERILAICHTAHFEDGALQVLQALRTLKFVPPETYLHWLSRAAMVWRADIFLALLTEMRLAGIEPRIPSLTSLEVGRKDPALTVMEGVRAVGLDPCFAMSVVYESIHLAIRGERRETGVSKRLRDAAMDKFGDMRVHKLNWDVQPIPQLLETQAAGLLLKQETFRRLKYHQVTRVESYLRMLPITTNVTLNLRKQLLRMSLLVNTHRVKRNKHKILAEYDAGKSLIDLSNSHNYPPVSLLRIILEARGFSPKAIRKALATPASLRYRDQQELNKATHYDSIHRSDPFLGQPAYSADSLETTLTHFFKSQGIRVKTQDDLWVEQEKIYGRPVISPDILLLDPVVINGVPVRWIDAKNYYGAHIVNKRLIAKQLASYVKEWGPGAVVFGMGFSDMMSIPGVVCLDMTPVPTTKYGSFKMVAKSYAYSFLNFFRWAPHLGSELTQEYAHANEMEMAKQDTTTKQVENSKQPLSEAKPDDAAKAKKA
ncbi:hypothetical protein SPRG_07579 [Saprolegnia parasitica CBS 223.65]|uniref:CDAN1-interacting nuclease 1 n=1 Tax=Saprolegnia parasitica (strain CBS 223.65) TaxID=695850 RepID=A0A067CKL8_SAPPC|nr:hypothetical protein SPRG_07579 [Saprolegnia parasitica CBS 223.65]KDO27332.1 hypothetical protein SPRG_07579 [Saprolegnia parasitica CBS 223.65]|eukprot:XP_012202103.1 hypothetical protein SPRG_07579 [Saprolegnia parasitica CBS 223.65]